MPGKSASRSNHGLAVSKRRGQRAKKVPADKWVRHKKRYPRSAEALFAEPLNQDPTPCHSDRMHQLSPRRAIEPFPTGTPPLTPQQLFWRSVGSRFLIAQAALTSGLNDADLESELGIANAGGRVLKKCVADFEGDHVMTPLVLDRLSRRAYLRGWLPRLADDWLYYQGALVAALSIGDMVPEPGDDLSEAVHYAAIGHVNWSRSYIKRVESAQKQLGMFCKRASAAYRCAVALCEIACIGANAELIYESGSAASSWTAALRALKKLECDLTETRRAASLVRWSALDPSLTDQIEVCGDLLSEPDLVFLRDVRRAIGCLTGRPRLSTSLESVKALVRSIWYLHVGIAWVDALYDGKQNKLLVEFRPEPLDIDEDTKWVSPCLSELPFAQNQSST